MHFAINTLCYLLDLNPKWYWMRIIYNNPPLTLESCDNEITPMNIGQFEQCRFYFYSSFTNSFVYSFTITVMIIIIPRVSDNRELYYHTTIVVQMIITAI